MHSPSSTRRDILKAAAAAALLSRVTVGAETFHSTLHKAIIIGPVTEEALTPLKEAGFEGVESRNICAEAEAAEGGNVARKMGMRVHSVMRGWAEFNSQDPAKVEGSMETTRKAMRAAKAYGADDILLVPCRINGMPMPDPWEFQIDFDPKNGRLDRVVDGDNSKFATYIDVHNRSAEKSRHAVEKLIPLAEELKIIIAIENVWNNMWVKPEFYKNFVTSFDSPWVRSYFDIGNHVKYAPPQEWIKTLGPLIVKLHFKDFLLNPDGHGGHFVHPRDGSINWTEVRKALDDIHYNGWGSIEDTGLPLAEFARRFDLIAEGE